MSNTDSSLVPKNEMVDRVFDALSAGTVSRARAMQALSLLTAYAGAFHLAMKQDYAKFFIKKELTIHEAACLIVGIRPTAFAETESNEWYKKICADGKIVFDFLVEDLEPFKPPNLSSLAEGLPAPHKMAPLLIAQVHRSSQAINNAIDDGHIDCSISDDKKSIAPKDLCNWAAAVFLDGLPDPFKEGARYHTLATLLPVRNHKRYTKEHERTIRTLQTAVRVVTRKLERKTGNSLKAKDIFAEMQIEWNRSCSDLEEQNPLTTNESDDFLSDDKLYRLLGPCLTQAKKSSVDR